ncbi:MAG TPA: hypothetical protein PKO44_02660 [Candidatus Omnitrophota bacterium]|nr:hypothetical protein [Candidatus Omnitrophota bacterium]
MDIMNQADIVVILAVLYFTCLGWVQGIMRFALAFAALLISSQIALTSFRGNYDILESLKIFFLLSTGLSILLWIGLSVWNRIITKTKRCNLLSRGLGAMIGFGWSLSLMLSIMFLFVMVRVDKPFFKKAKRITEQSWTYTLAESKIFSRYPIYQALKKIHEQPDLLLQSTASSIEGAQGDRTMPDESIQAIYYDEKLQAILQDERITKLIEEKDVARLIANPKIQALLKDKAFVQKLLDLYNHTLKENF